MWSEFFHGTREKHALENTKAREIIKMNKISTEEDEE